MNAILLGNILSLCAMISDSFSGTRKKHSEIMAVQILSQFFYGASTIALKGYSGTAQNIVAIFRNYAAMKNVKSKVIEWTLILLGVVLGAWFNNRGLFGWLPIIANLEYSIAVFKLKDNVKALKISLIINLLMFFVFQIGIYNYVGALSCTVIAATTTISLIRSWNDTDESEEADADTEAEGSAADTEAEDTAAEAAPEE